MNEMFSELARKAIEFARDEAARLRHDYIGTEHLLLGLIRLGEGMAIDIIVNIGLDLEIQGYPISANCPGSVDFVIDAYGETIDGEGACIASVAGMFDLDLALIVTGTVADDEVEGEIAIDIAGWFELPSPFTGEFPEVGEMTGDFSYDYSGVMVEGTIEAHRVAKTP